MLNNAHRDEALAVYCASRLGLGGIVQLWCRGRNVGSVLAGHFFGPSGEARALPAAGELRYGILAAGAQHLDEVVLAGTPWGMEINCHGGTAPAKAVLGFLDQLGVEQISASQWWAGEVTAQRTPLPTAEAGIRLARATAPLPTQVLTAGLSLAEALKWVRMQPTPDEAVATVGEWVKTASASLAARKRYTIALVGRPNVGKSTLFNALLVRDRALVSPFAGTTRDAIAHRLQPQGVDVELIDTAGLFAGAGGVDREAVARSRRQARTADLRLFLLDGASAPTEADATAWALCSDRPTCLVQSRSDLPLAQGWEAARSRYRLPRPEQAVAAGLEASVQALARRIACACARIGGFEAWMNNSTLPSCLVVSQRQARRLGEALEAFQRGAETEAAAALDRVAGQVDRRRELAAAVAEWDAEQPEEQTTSTGVEHG